MRIKEGLEVHHMKIHMNIVTMKGLVLAEEVMINIQDIVMMKEEVLDMIKKVDSIMITKEVPLVQKLSMIGVERIDLEMAGKWKTEGYLMEIRKWKAGHLSGQKRTLPAPLWYVLSERFWEIM
jgi:hypothetical protein